MSRLAGLALALEHLGVPRDTDRLPGRLRLQKSIFLAQQAGVDLDYRFGWYIRGPYSPVLTRDYFALSAASAEEAIAGYRLTDEARAALDGILPLFSVPAGVNLRPEQWLELVGSWRYLKQVSRLSDEKARSLMQRQKPALVQYVGRARQALASVGLAA